MEIVVAGAEEVVVVVAVVVLMLVDKLFSLYRQRRGRRADYYELLVHVWAQGGQERWEVTGRAEEERTVGLGGWKEGEEKRRGEGKGEGFRAQNGKEGRGGEERREKWRSRAEEGRRGEDREM
eukprot:768695-Hanusia_phi.AAC.5